MADYFILQVSFLTIWLSVSLVLASVITLTISICEVPFLANCKMKFSPSLTFEK